MVKRKIISYTDGDFNSIKKSLVEYAKRYYPDTYQDFNEASFGSLMTDMVAYIGDQLSYYMDYQTNESFLDSAIEYKNVVRLAKQLGYKHPGAAAAQGVVSLYVLVPSISLGLGPDPDYIPILERGTAFTSNSGASFTLVESVNFSNPNNEVVVARVDSTTGTPTYFAIKAFGKVISGNYGQQAVTIGNYQRFRNINLGTAGISEILSVTDSEGNDYFEVEHLSQDVIYDEVPNFNGDRSTTPYLLRARVVPRRFIVDFNEIHDATLTFGAGTADNLTTDLFADPANVVLDMHGRDYISKTTYDPTVLTKTDKMGVAPANTTLTIAYRSNAVGDVNVSAGGLTTVVAPSFFFENRDALSSSEVGFVINSLEVINEEPITGDTRLLSVNEIRNHAISTYATQNRAVTKSDYENLAYRMPAQFGKISRSTISQDRDSMKRNLNMYVLGRNIEGFFTTANHTTKENLKIWLSRYKMINDTIDILDAKVVNVGIEFEVISELTANKHFVLSSCLSALQSSLDVPLNIGEPLYLAQIYRILNRVPGVVDTTRVKFVRKSGSNYSSTLYDVDSHMSSDGRYLLAEEDVMFEVRYPGSDFVGVVK